MNKEKEPKEKNSLLKDVGKFLEGTGLKYAVGGLLLFNPVVAVSVLSTVAITELSKQRKK